VEHLSTALVGWARQAMKHLPVTGSRPLQSKARRDLERERQSLTQMRNMVTKGKAVGHHWNKCEKKCAVYIQQEWGHVEEHKDVWLAGLCKAIVNVRQLERKEARRMKRGNTDGWDANPNAFVRRVLRGDKSGAILSVTDPADKKLKTEPADVKRVLHDHFRAVFEVDPREERIVEEADWVEEMYQPKAGVRPEWYDGLMAPVDVGE